MLSCFWQLVVGAAPGLEGSPGRDAAGCFELYSDLIAAQQLILPSAMAANATAATAAFLTWWRLRVRALP
ncbi:hypothetical protein CYMTET_35235 [Cymbomonas tetramitiformis]|uniref:Uncharacterized protein n=1 Tax=Cymbomonas tetramitiformis TaxID=36881 RepID=A0AAE0KPD5_9CHLO|nr:hypothetical protein CYMTET_35235 [Cymbomonas tetramitiformis]